MNWNSRHEGAVKKRLKFHIYELSYYPNSQFTFQIAMSPPDKLITLYSHSIAE